MGIWDWLFGGKMPPKTVLAAHDDFVVCWSPSHSLEVWAAYRVPFEPMIEGAVQLRREIQSVLDSDKMIPAGPTIFRHAIYASSTTESTDVENVTCYNIGRWNSISAKKRFLRLERKFELTEISPAQMCSKAQHYWRYLLAPIDSGFLCWQPDKKDAIEIHVRNISCDKLSSAAHIWYEIKTVMKSDLSRWWGWNRVGDTVFGMYVRVALPKSIWLQRSIEVKPLVDGITAALHWQTDSDQTLSETLVSRLSTKIGVSPKEINNLLKMSKGAVLEQHQAFVLRGNGFQVSPRDDLCAALEVRLGPTEEEHASLGFCAFKISPAH